jgi:hypothetical protein
MPSCNATVTNPTISGMHCTATIQLRVAAADPDPVRSFAFSFPITDTVPAIRERAKDRIQQEWQAYLEDQTRLARATTLLGQITGASYNLSW